MYFGPQVQKLTDIQISGDGHSEKDFLENWIGAYIPIRIPKKHLNAHLYKSHPKELTSFNILYLVHKLQFPGVILFITMIQGHLVSLMRWSDKNSSTSSKCQYTKVGKDVNNFFLVFLWKGSENHFQLVAEMSDDVFHSRRKVLTNIAQRTWWANWCFFPIGKCQGLWQGHRVHGSL